MMGCPSSLSSVYATGAPSGEPASVIVHSVPSLARCTTVRAVSAGEGWLVLALVVDARVVGSS